MKDFDETQEYGGYAEIGPNPTGDPVAYGVIVADWSLDMISRAKKLLEKQINKVVPLLYRNKVGWIVKAPPSRYGLERQGTVGWKYTP